MTPLNKALVQLTKRAERHSDELLKRTFVAVGPVFHILSTVDHQLIFGRRGTGKTHLLSVLNKQRNWLVKLSFKLT